MSISMTSRFLKPIRACDRDTQSSEAVSYMSPLPHDYRL